jgi:hypothetical protein
MEQMGLTVREGRTMMEDLIVLVPQGAEPTYPLVVEVKSGKDPSPDKQALRELDDWVFDLSGEDLIRKMQHPGDASVGLFTHGMFTWRPHHPSPHKGVFIYNGPTYVPFEQRSPNWLGYNEEAFAKKRGFCVMALCTLINFADRVKNGAVQLDALWKLIHDTEGVLPPPK